MAVKVVKMYPNHWVRSLTFHTLPRVQTWIKGKEVTTLALQNVPWSSALSEEDNKKTFQERQISACNLAALAGPAIFVGLYSQLTTIGERKNADHSQTTELLLQSWLNIFLFWYTVPYSLHLYLCSVYDFISVSQKHQFWMALYKFRKQWPALCWLEDTSAV